MEHQEAIAVLKNLLSKDLLKSEEKEAIFTAIGVLAWTSLSKARIKSMRDKRERLKNEPSKTDFKLPPRGRKAKIGFEA